MRASLTIEVDATELDEPTTAQALKYARRAASRLGIPSVGEVTPALTGDSFLVRFDVTVEPVTA